MKITIVKPGRFAAFTAITSFSLGAGAALWIGGCTEQLPERPLPEMGEYTEMRAVSNREPPRRGHDRDDR